MPTEAASPGPRAPAAPPLRLHHDLPRTVEAGASIRWSCTLEATRELAAHSRIGLARLWPSDWGDLHGQSRIGCGAGSFEHYLRHARDAALLDFVGHQANCFLVRDSEWEEQRRATAALPEPTRAALWQALRARRTWGTTGARIPLEPEADGLPMGSSCVPWSPPALRVRVEGTAPLEAVELMCGERVVFAAPLAGEGRSDRMRVAWSGLSARGNFARARMVWDGGLVVEQRRILEARGWALDTPEEGVTAQGQDAIAWRSLTAGDWDGVILRLEETPRTTLAFTAGPLTCRLPLATLGEAPRLIAREDPMRRLELRRLPRVPPPATWSGMVRDPDRSPGELAYWLRVRQSDGEQAWSSPIWVTLEAPATTPEEER